jgi:Raf kinase inhibitor-like YbhB/YbcL family protein
MEPITKTELKITSPAFEDGGAIPSKYTCEGENVNPALSIHMFPVEAKSFVLFVEDPDAAGGTFDHWIVWNIYPAEIIAENSIPGVEGKNGFGKNSYFGPCPPNGTHRYIFKIIALDAMLDIREGAPKSEIERAMQEHVIGTGELSGTYKKMNKMPTAL